jgi:glucosamine--fructose-6-phosphate aminotransferase (isomerizing)
MSMVNEKTVVVGLLSEGNRRYEQAVLDEMQAKGARILALAAHHGSIQFDTDMSEYAYGVLYLPVLQLLAFYRSLSKSLNPDRPNALTAVVKLDL